MLSYPFSNLLLFLSIHINVHTTKLKAFTFEFYFFVLIIIYCLFTHSAEHTHFPLDVEKNSLLYADVMFIWSVIASSGASVANDRSVHRCSCNTQ